MSLTVSNDPIEDGSHTRYVLLTPQVAALTGIDGLIGHYMQVGPVKALLVTPDGESSEVTAEYTPTVGTGLWSVWTVGDDGLVVEEIAYRSDGTVDFHWKFVPGFTSDEVPQVATGTGR